MSKRRSYTREFKLEAIRLWQTVDKSAREVEEDLEPKDQAMPAHLC